MKTIALLSCEHLDDNYLEQCVQDCFDRGEAPFSWALFYSGILDLTNQENYNAALEAGVAWLKNAELVACYCPRMIDCSVSRNLMSRLRSSRHRVSERSILKICAMCDVREYLSPQTAKRSGWQMHSMFWYCPKCSDKLTRNFDGLLLYKEGLPCNTKSSKTE